MKGIKIKNLEKAKRTAIEIKDAYKYSEQIQRTTAQKIHTEFKQKKWSTKIWQLDATMLVKYIISQNCTDDLIRAGRILLAIQDTIIKDGKRSDLCIPPLTNRLLKLTNIDRATIMWFTSSISEYYYRAQQTLVSVEEKKRLYWEEGKCYITLYKFLLWCQEQNITVDYRNKNSINQAIMSYLNRNEQAKSQTRHAIFQRFTEALKIAGFIINDCILKILNRQGLCEGFSQQINNAIDEFLSIKSNPNNPKKFYVKGYGSIPKQKVVKSWKKSTVKGAKYYIYALYRHCCRGKTPRAQVSLWAPKYTDVENVPGKHTLNWWNIMESWFGYLYNRPDTPKNYKREILKILNEPPALVKNGEGKKPVFLTPLELVLVEKLLEKISKDEHMMKIKIMFLLGCLAGLRAFEIVQVTLNMFERDRKTGLLKLDERGRAILHLPPQKTKGEYSPSHPKYGTIIVPYLAKIINTYLQSEAMEGAISAADKGIDVYLLHKGNHWSEGKLDDKYVVKFFQYHKKILSKALVHHPRGTTFSSHDLRHSCNDLILSLAVLWRSNVRIAEIHERHNPDRRGSSVNIRHYSRPVTKTAYYDAVSYALGFPWNEEAVKKWMKEKGYNLETGELPDELNNSYLELLLGISPGQNSQSRVVQPQSSTTTGSDEHEKIKAVTEKLKCSQKQLWSDVKNNIIRENTAEQRFAQLCKQAIDNLEHLKIGSSNQHFKYTCEQTIKLIQIGSRNYKEPLDV